MTRRSWLLVCLATVEAATCQLGFADSIWDRRDPRAAYLFIDNKARHVGDLLTVVVNESTDASNTEQRKMAKDTAASGKFNFAGKTSGGTGGQAAAAALSIDQSADRSFQGSAQYQSNRQLLDGLMVTVVDVLPNGNLVVEGSRRRKVSNETRWLRVTGVVRPNDIGIPNTINSQSIADINIVYEGGGPESRLHESGMGWSPDEQALAVLTTLCGGDSHHAKKHPCSVADACRDGGLVRHLSSRSPH